LKPDKRFTAKPKQFWAHVRTISQEVGYTDRTTKTILIPSLNAIRKKFDTLGLSSIHIADAEGELTDFGKSLFSSAVRLKYVVKAWKPMLVRVSNHLRVSTI
jgi:hypothetical protein